MAENFITVSRADNGAALKVWYGRDRLTGRPDEVRLYDFDEAGSRAAFKARLRDLLRGTASPLPARTRYRVEFTPAENGYMVRRMAPREQGGAAEPARVYRLPDDTQALEEWLASLD